MADSKVEVVDLGFVNAYLLKTHKGFVLIDTGMPAQWPALESRLKSSGCGPGLLKLVILTHGDLDHAGNCIRLKETYRAAIAAHRGELQVLQTGVSPKRSIRGLSRRIMFALLRLARRVRGSAAKPEGFTPDVLLEDGQSLAAYGLAAQVIHLPGHTKGSIAVLAADGSLFVGDTWTNRKKPAPSPFVENAGEYRESLEKVRRLAGPGGPVETIYPGHGRPFQADQASSILL